MNSPPCKVTTQLHDKDEFKVDNRLDISKRLSLEMESLLGAIQRQLTVNAATITREGRRYNYGQTIMVILYIMTYLFTVSLHNKNVVVIMWLTIYTSFYR